MAQVSRKTWKGFEKCKCKCNNHEDKISRHLKLSGIKGRKRWQYSNHNERRFYVRMLSAAKHKTQGVSYLRFDIQKVQNQVTESYTIENTNYHDLCKSY